MTENSQTGPALDRFLVETPEATSTSGELAETACRARAGDMVRRDAGAISPEAVRPYAIVKAADSFK